MIYIVQVNNFVNIYTILHNNASWLEQNAGYVAENVCYGSDM